MASDALVLGPARGLLARAADAVGAAIRRRPDPTWYTRLDAKDPEVELTYLGTAGFVITHASRRIAIDPFVTRPDLLTTLTRRLVPDEQRIARLLPSAVDDVLVGHAHYDHVLDAPSLCLRTGARLVGSRSACQVGRAAGLPESQLRETVGHEPIACGPLVVTGLPSRHGRVFGRVPMPGPIEAPPPWPPRLRELRCGPVLDWLVDTGRLRILHVDSADFLPWSFEGLHVDVLCLCAAGWRSRPRYVEEAISLLRPRYVVPCHWDSLFAPLEPDPLLLPGVDLPGFLEAIRKAGARPLLTPILGTQRIAAAR